MLDTQYKRGWNAWVTKNAALIEAHRDTPLDPFWDGYEDAQAGQVDWLMEGATEAERERALVVYK